MIAGLLVPAMRFGGVWAPRRAIIQPSRNPAVRSTLRREMAGLLVGIENPPRGWAGGGVGLRVRWGLRRLPEPVLL